MNFKPSLWKSVSSAISGIATNFLTAVWFGPQLCSCNDFTCDCIKHRWMDTAFNPMPIIISLVVIIFIYSLWSYIQKKES